LPCALPEPGKDLSGLDFSGFHTTEGSEQDFSQFARTIPFKTLKDIQKSQGAMIAGVVMLVGEKMSQWCPDAGVKRVPGHGPRHCVRTSSAFAFALDHEPEGARDSNHECFNPMSELAVTNRHQSQFPAQSDLFSPSNPSQASGLTETSVRRSEITNVVESVHFLHADMVGDGHKPSPRRTLRPWEGVSPTTLTQSSTASITILVSMQQVILKDEQQNYGRSRYRCNPKNARFVADDRQRASVSIENPRQSISNNAKFIVHFTFTLQ
jgi:hypothetical protein